ncbi:hypothetical protein DFH06DRAFT_1149022 [Mycena polygramma]|nr:hypothetical protein DFH06DRAFT_1149022 [Mycena polygramma]
MSTPARPNPPDPLRYAKSLTKDDTYYLRHPTDCLLGPDNFTWIEPVLAVQNQTQSTTSSHTAPAVVQTTTGTTQGPRSTASTSTKKQNGRSSHSRPSRNRPYSPPQYQEYTHEYGRSQGHGYRTGRQQYRAARYRSRSRDYERSPSPAYRSHGSPSRHNNRGGRRDESRDARGSADRHSSPRQTPAAHDNKDEPTRTRTATPTPPPAPQVASRGPFVAISPPNICDARTDTHRHPIFPSNISAQAEAMSPGAAVRTSAYRKKEEKRARAIPLPGTGPRTLEARSVHDLGAWFPLTVHNLAAAINLLRWSDAGEPTARRFVLRTEQEFGLNSGAARNEGVAHIMGQQANSRRAYMLATTGVAPSAKVKRGASPFDDNELTPDDELEPKPDEEMPHVKSKPDEDLEMPQVTQSPPEWAMPPGTENDGFPSAETTVPDAVTFFQLSATEGWPLGMRTTQGEFPTTEYAVPGEDDVLAELTLLHLCPASDDTTVGLDAHATFRKKTMHLFSARGLFGHYVTLGGYHTGTWPMHDRFNFETAGLSYSQIASWYSAHGIAPGDATSTALESYARSHRNRAEKKLDPRGTEFAQWPRNVDALKYITATDVTPWAAIEYSELRPGLQTVCPRRPASASSPEDVDMDKENKI